MIGGWLGRSIGHWFGSRSSDNPDGPTLPPFSAFTDSALGRLNSQWSRDDQDLLEIVPFVIEVLNFGR